MDVTATEALGRWDQREEHRDRDVLSMLKSMDAAEDERKRVPNSHIPAYMVEIMAAGSSTTSHTATFACFELMRHPRQAEKLRQELEATYPDAQKIDETKMMKLPYLDAVLRETMRMMPMIPGPLPRFLGEGVGVAGMKVPILQLKGFGWARLVSADSYSPDTSRRGSFYSCIEPGASS